MNYTWIIILVMMVVGNLIINVFESYLSVIVVNAAILVGGYFLLRRDPRVDLRSSMLFLVGLSVINVLADFGIMSSMMANVACVALLIWSMAGGGRSR
jgi:4-amino-4-deoxy-L-arabinose transferase-like glycosyltransferase